MRRWLMPKRKPVKRATRKRRVRREPRKDPNQAAFDLVARLAGK